MMRALFAMAALLVLACGGASAQSVVIGPNGVAIYDRNGAGFGCAKAIADRPITITTAAAGATIAGGEAIGAMIAITAIETKTGSAITTTAAMAMAGATAGLTATATAAAWSGAIG